MDFKENIIDWFFSGGIRIFLIAIGTFIFLRILKTVVHHIMDQVLKKTYNRQSEAALAKRQKTLESVANATLKIVIWVISGLMILSELGVDIAPLIAGAGIVGIALGFGGQYLVRDIIAGLFIIIEDQFRKGDVVEIAGSSGLVQDVNLRRTILRDLDGAEHHIPNGEITKTLNKTKFWSRIHLNIGIAYEADIDKAFEILNEVGKEFAEDEKWKDSIIKVPEVIGLDELADSAVVIKILGEIKPGKQWDAMRELNLRIKKALDKAHIEIPFPQITISKK
jgi:small conductance mechanosensitive channel